MRQLWAIFACLLPICFSVLGDDLAGKPVAIDGTIHTPQEIMPIADQSIMAYKIADLDEAQVAELIQSLKEKRHTLDNLNRISVNGDSRKLRRLVITDTLAALLKRGDKAYQEGDLGTAIGCYRYMIRLDSTLSSGYCYVGDVFYKQEQYDSAEVYFRKATERSFIDYQAHWFLADALWNLSRRNEALQEITLAHILNPNHETLASVFKGYRERIGRPVDDWVYELHCEIHQDPTDSHVVHIRTEVEWIMYAVVKALWKYEPGYAEKMTGKKQGSLTSTLEEKEALAAALAVLEREDPALGKKIGRIVEDDKFGEFFWYDIVSRDYPEALLMQPEDMIMKVAQYVDSYH